MHSNRIHQIQRRAKRRFLVISLAATAFAGYSAVSLFGQDTLPRQISVAKMSVTPAVKSVGIRLVGIGEKSAPASNVGTMQLPAPLPSRFPAPPANAEPKLPSMLPIPVSGAAPSTGTDLLPVSSGFAQLAAPPRMSESMVKSTTGKVVMKIGKDEAANAGLVAPSTQTTHSSQVPGLANKEPIVDFRVVESTATAQPAKMPPFLIESSAKRAASQLELPSKPVRTLSTPVRISMADINRPEQIANISMEARSANPVMNRMPQLVKPKPTQVSHTVILAQSTDLDTSSTIEQPDDLIPPVDVDSSLVPNSLAKSKKKTGVNATLSNYSESVVTDAIPDSFVSSSALDQSSKSDSRRIQQTAGDSIVGDNGSFGDDSVDSMRRRFDARLVSQAPIATVEIECLTATSMEIPGKLSAIAVLDESVCKVLHNERTVSLVGNQVGTTLVQIWTAELGSKPQIIRVNVSQGWGKVQATRTEVNDIKQVIAQGFPRADINIVTKEDGSLEVRGTTESEESAKRVLELVRKLYLVPVKDKLTVSN